MRRWKRDKPRERLGLYWHQLWLCLTCTRPPCAPYAAPAPAPQPRSTCAPGSQRGTEESKGRCRREQVKKLTSCPRSHPLVPTAERLRCLTAPQTTLGKAVPAAGAVGWGTSAEIHAAKVAGPNIRTMMTALPFPEPPAPPAGPCWTRLARASGAPPAGWTSSGRHPCQHWLGARPSDSPEAAGNSRGQGTRN